EGRRVDELYGESNLAYRDRGRRIVIRVEKAGFRTSNVGVDWNASGSQVDGEGAVRRRGGGAGRGDGRTDERVDRCARNRHEVGVIDDALDSHGRRRRCR